MRNLFPLFLFFLAFASGCKKPQPVPPTLLLSGEIAQRDSARSLIAIIQTGVDAFTQDTLAVKANRFELNYATDSVVKINLLSDSDVYSVYMGGGDTLHLKIQDDSLQVVGKIKPYTLWSINNYINNEAAPFAHYPLIIRDQINKYRANSAKSATGRRMPYVLLKDMKGENISTLDARGKYRLITFWASWDSLSVSKVKQLPALAKKLDKKAIEFINISLDANDSIWQKEVNTLKLPGRNIRLKEGFADEKAQTLGVTTLPSNLILNMESNIMDRNIFGKTLEEYLEKEVKVEKKPTQKSKENAPLPKQTIR